MTEVINKNGIPFDIDAIATDLNNKMDRDGLNSLASICVESYQSGYSWYRVYSDGWCEQGGAVPYESGVNAVAIQFMKPYVDIPNLQISAVTTNGAYVNAVINAWGITNTGFTKQYHTVVGNGWSWRACGYIN